MTIPTFVFGIVLAVLLGAGFHFLRGTGEKPLSTYLGVAQIGFWVGHIIANLFEMDFAKLGALQIGIGVIGALTLLALYDMMGRFEPPATSDDN